MQRYNERDSGWVGAGPDDDLDRQLLEEDDAFDRSQPHILTALGPVEPAALGPALSGELIGRLAAQPSGIAPDGRHELLAELEDLYASGVRGVAVECAQSQIGLLHWLAGRVQPNLVLLAPPAALAKHHPPPELGGLLIDSGDANRVALAADLALAQRIPVRIAANGDATNAIEAALALAGAGIPEHSISISGLNLVNASVALAGCGATIVVTPDFASLAHSAQSIADLAAAGFGDRLAIASGISARTDLLAFGGERGLGWTMATAPLLLMDAGMDALAVRALFIDNPARMLTIAGENDRTHD
jgi:hypothetical protein